MKEIGILAVACCFVTTCLEAQEMSNRNVDDTFAEFAKGPEQARTKVWWFHGENITTKEGITADLEAFKEQGVGGVVYYDQQHGPGAPEALPSMSQEWWNMLKFAAQEAQRIGLTFEVSLSNGYVAGGPWITPELGMQAVFSTATFIKGGEHYNQKLPSTGREYENDIAVLAIPTKRELHKSINCFNDDLVVSRDTIVMLASFETPFTARSFSYWSNGDNKGAQSIINVPCEPQETFCGNWFTLLPDLGELEVSLDGKQWQKVCNLPPCYRMQTLCPNATVSFPATTGRYFRLNLHGWTAEGKSHKDLVLKNVVLSAKAATYRWEERAAYASEYIRGIQTPDYKDEEVVFLDKLLDISDKLDEQGILNWKAPRGDDWLVLRFVYAPTYGKTKHGRPNLMGLECDKLSEHAVKIHWKHYPQPIIDTLSAIGCKPFGICMDSHEAGNQNWTADFPDLFKKECGYNIIPYLPAMQGYIVESVEKTEKFLHDLRRTIANGISNRYCATLQQMADESGVHFTAQATGNGQSICSDNIMAKGKVERPQGEFWARHHDGSFDIKEASSAAHLYGRQIASAEAYTELCYSHMLGEMKDETDMAAAFQVNELVVCASEYQPWLDRYPGNTGNTWDFALNRNNTLWPFSRPFWDYQARNSFIQRQGMPIVDILVYTGDAAPMKILAHRLPIIPEGYDFDVCTTDAIHHRLSVEDGKLKTPDGMAYQLLAIEKSAMVKPETEEIIQRWKEQGLLVYDNRVMGDSAMAKILIEANIRPDMEVHSNYQPTDRIWFTHRRTHDADYYFIVNHSKTTHFADSIILRTSFGEAEWWDALHGKRLALPAIQTSNGLKVNIKLAPDEAGFIVARDKTAEGLSMYQFQEEEIVSTIPGSWTVTFDTLLGGPKKPVVFQELTDWTQSSVPEIRYFSGKATYENNIDFMKNETAHKYLLRIPGLKGIAKVWINDRNVGIIWCTPWEVDITSYLRNGNNSIRIEVRNSIVNRMVGDASLPENERYTWAYTPIYTEKSPLVSSGIIGNVFIVEKK